MSEFKFEWLVKDRVALLSDFPVTVDAANVQTIMQIMKRLFEESTSDHIHYINDVSNLQRIPISMSSLTGGIPMLRNKRLASVSIVGKLQTPLVKVLMKALAGSLPLHFAKDTPTALKDLYARHPDLAQLTQD